MTTMVTARLAPGQSIDVDSFADIVSAAATVEWGADGLLSVTFDADLAACELAAVRCRIASADPADESTRLDLVGLLGQAPPTTEERLARLEAMCEALAKLGLGFEP